jgi:sec-independent protein translocase protein TatA
MFQSIGSTELLILGGILFLLFGGKKIPELIKGMGDAIKEFRKASRDDSDKKS